MNGRHQEGLDALDKDPLTILERRIRDEREDANEEIELLKKEGEKSGLDRPDPDQWIVDMKVAEGRYIAFDRVLNIIRLVKDEYGDNQVL